FDKRFKAQIAARRDKVFFTSSSALVVLIPRFLVIPRFAESPANRFFDSHARHGVPPGLSRDAEVRALRIFAQRELDAGQRTFKRKLRRGLAPTQLNNQRLPSDGIRGAVKNIRRRDSPGEITVNVDVL